MFLRKIYDYGLIVTSGNSEAKLLQVFFKKFEEIIQGRKTNLLEVDIVNIGQKNFRFSNEFMNIEVEKFHEFIKKCIQYIKRNLNWEKSVVYPFVYFVFVLMKI